MWSGTHEAPIWLSSHFPVDAEAYGHVPGHEQVQHGIVVRNTFIDVCQPEDTDSDESQSMSPKNRRNLSAPPSPARRGRGGDTWEVESGEEEEEDDPGSIPSYQWSPENNLFMAAATKLWSDPARHNRDGAAGDPKFIGSPGRRPRFGLPERVGPPPPPQEPPPPPHEVPAYMAGNGRAARPGPVGVPLSFVQSSGGEDTEVPRRAPERGPVPGAAAPVGPLGPADRGPFHPAPGPFVQGVAGINISAALAAVGQGTGGGGRRGTADGGRGRGRGEAVKSGPMPLSGGGPKRTDYIRKYGAGASADADGHPGQQAITTMMLKNIPCRKSQEDVMAQIDKKGFGGLYDFFYLPRDVKFRANLGYAFINFVSPDDAARFQQEMNGYRFANSGSSKACAVVPAHVQGLMNNLAAFKRTEVMRSNRKPYFSGQPSHREGAGGTPDEANKF